VIEFIKNWTVNIVVLVLFIVITEMLLPRGKMKKYANLMTGTILVIAIIEPVTGLFGKAFDFSYSQAVTAGSIDKREIEKASRMFGEEQIRQTIRLYRNRIIEQIEYQAREVDGVYDAKADVIINEDWNSPGFGEIRRVYIEVEGDPDEPAAPHNRGIRKSGSIGAAGDGGADMIMIPDVREVERIRIGDPGSIPERTVPDRELEEKITERISDVFGLNRENIVITQFAR